MMDILFESFVLIALLGLFFAIIQQGVRLGVQDGAGWRLVMGGFILLIFGSLMDLMDEFYDSLAIDLLGEMVGSVGGLTFLAVGFWHWMPAMRQGRQAELALQESNATLAQRVEERTRELSQAMARLERLAFALDEHAIVTMTDAEGRITTVNRKFEEVSQFRAGELIGQTHRMIKSGLHPPEFYAGMWETVSRGEVWHGEVCNRRKDGTLYWQDSTIVPFLDEQGHPYQYVAIRTDITRRKEMENALLNYQSELEEIIRRRTADLARARDEAVRASRSKNDFLATMSHEIRTPLNGVVGILDLLSRQPLDAKSREYAQMAVDAGKNLLFLINDILDFSRIEAGQLVLERVDFDLRAVVDQSLLTLAPEAHTKGLSLTGFIPAEAPTLLRGDPNRLRQVFTNLLGNAVKFTPPEGTVELFGGPVTQEGSRIEFLFEVRDTGIGIPVEKREGIFARFSQADVSIARQYGGSGLGLAICRALVEQMQGEIGVDANPYAPTGAVFHFTVQLEMREPGAGMASAIGEMRRAMGHLRILSAGSRGLQRMLLENIMDSWGVAHTHVEEVESVVNLAREAVTNQRPFDLVILDQPLSGEGRGGVFVALRHLQPPPVIILLTDLAQSHTPERKGMAILKKPFTPSRLHGVMSRLLPGLPPVAVEEREAEPRQGGFKKVRLLVVDDQLTNLKVAVGMLTTLGCQPNRLVTARNGREALAHFQDGGFDLVLLDCRMPGMDGYQVAQEMREMENQEGRKRTPVIAFTADVTPDSHALCQQSGMDGMLTKPVTLEALRKTLEQHLGPRPEEENNGVWGEALREFGLSDESLAEVAEVILSDLPPLMESLEQDLVRGNEEAARAKSHVLKGSMANVLFPMVQELTLALHQRIRDSEWEEAQRTLFRLRGEFSPIFQELEQVARKERQEA